MIARRSILRACVCGGDRPTDGPTDTLYDRATHNRLTCLTQATPEERDRAGDTRTRQVSPAACSRSEEANGTRAGARGTQICVLLSTNFTLHTRTFIRAHKRRALVTLLLLLPPLVMGAFVAKPKGGDGSGSSYAPTVSGLGGPDGFLRDTCIEGILNLENRQVNNDTFAKISAVQQVTRQVLSLSLANNRITALVFDEAGGNVLAAALVPAARQSSGGAADVSTNASPAAPTASVDDDDDLEREQSVLRSRVGKSPPPPAPPLRSSANWPMLENLDLSGNNELFNYSGLASVTATLRSLRLANNGIFKVPTDVWALSNLTKLDLSHNRLLVLPVGISMLTKLNSLKLSHNSLVSNGTTSCLPEEMRLCSRLRRLDLSHNKLRELPVNWRVDREHQRRSTLRQGQSSNAGTAASSPRIKAGDASRSPVLQSKRATGSPSFSLAGGGAFKKADPNDPPPSLTLGGSSFTAVSAAIAAAAAAASAPPVPIKYFDPNRVSYIQITLLNLSNNQIDSLSPSIGLLRSLNSLNLGYNKLRSLPTEIALLTELKYLDLRFNSLPSLLTEICQLPRLSKLCLQNNKISGLPYEIRKLKKLTHFFISSNQLVDLPDVISEIRNVRVLKLCNNKLLTIPDSMFRLQKLRLLDLRYGPNGEMHEAEMSTSTRQPATQAHRPLAPVACRMFLLFLLSPSLSASTS